MGPGELMYSTTVNARPFDSLLVANRGEIACRIIRTAQRLGYRTIAVFSDADENSLHTQLADTAVRLGPAEVSESYLNVERLLHAATITGAEAIIPGYGFLSENADFAQAVLDAGLVWVGPPPAAIDAMGNKATAKARMHEANVPCVPGFSEQNPSIEALSNAANNIGFPVLVKAAAGGGGRGMRRVDSANDLEAAVLSAKREALNAFGDDSVLLERLVEYGRHVELQVFGDTQGHVIHLGERDCSVQRRHQKVIEEAPSPAVDDALRTTMGAAACAAARAVNYVGAGTVEFLLAPDDSFYFLEMNTRLQVEHPVTECVTGFDLVEWQLRIAEGQPLPADQSDITLTGHAIEVRLYAEDPTKGGLPQPGPITLYDAPSNIRVDDGLLPSGAIPANYDPMVAKLVAAGPDRITARRRLLQSLTELVFVGPKTNREQLAAILSHIDFTTGDVHTGWLESHPNLNADPAPPDELQAVAAAIYLLETAPAQPFRSSPRGPVRRVLCIDNQDITCRATHSGHGITISVDADEPTPPHQITMLGSGTRRQVRVNDSIHRVQVVSVGHQLYVRYRHSECVVCNAQFAQHIGQKTSDGHVRMPMTGTVLQLCVENGDAVTEGQDLIVVEAMKLETTLKAPFAGTVHDLRTSVGESMPTDAALMRIEPETIDTGSDNNEEE